MKRNYSGSLFTLTLVAAFGSSAQTVPPEMWMGAPIATTGHQMSREEVVAAFAESAAHAQATQENWVGDVTSASAGGGMLSRAEVRADFNLYAQAGLANYPSRIYFEPQSAEAAQRSALYKRLRAGPEFAQEVDRIKNRHIPALADASGSDASAD